MCGFSGFIDLARSRDRAESERLARAMAETLLTRGPDDGSAWADPDAGYAVGFQRLAIIDLSTAGRQPMVSADGRYVIAYNGEVYNAPEMRRDLESRGSRFRGHSDTEVILEACSAHGVAAAVEKCIGMFAMALWDRETRSLYLVRDRMGIKPVYWGRVGRTVLFGSQPKSFFAHPDWRPEIDRVAVAGYCRFGYVPTPRSIFAGVSKLRPGHMVRIDGNGEAESTCYWDIGDIAAAGVSGRTDLDDAAATDELESLLRDAVRRRMLADVPVGAFLSGGIDSSTVVALMQAESRGPVKTFSIGFEETGFDEAPHAKAVAGHLGTEHHELYVTPRQAMDVIPGIPDWYDEPFSDSSQIPTYLVSELTRQSVVVSLSGDGGDELFAGYPRYAYALRLARVASFVPGGLRAAARAGIRALSAQTWDRLARAVPARWRPGNVGVRAHRLAELLERGARESLYRDMVSHWHDSAGLLPGGSFPDEEVWGLDLEARFPDFTDRMQLIDMQTYLPDDILTKVDRASMAVSLEARVPLLDHRVVEMSWRLPFRHKVRDGQTKWLLRQVLHRHVPRELIERPKMGFGVPIGEWLRGPLRDWAEDLLSEPGLREDGLLDPAPVRSRWREHLAGTVNWQYPLWVVLMLQAWRRRWPGAAA